MARAANRECSCALATDWGGAYGISGRTPAFYRLPVGNSDAALVHLELANGKTMRDVFVAPQGQVVGSLRSRLADCRGSVGIHGSLLVGKVGGWLVELAASWAIVMILTGLSPLVAEGRERQVAVRRRRLAAS